MTAEGAEKSQQCHKYFLQYTTFASERPQVRIWGRQSALLARAPSNLVTPLTSVPDHFYNSEVFTCHVHTHSVLIFPCLHEDCFAKKKWRIRCFRSINVHNFSSV